MSSKPIKENTCQNCAFLKVERVHGISGNVKHSSGWSKEERENKEPKYYERGGVSPSCHKGVWDMGVERKFTLEQLLEEDREDNCFYYPYREGTGLLFDAAEELEARQFEKLHLQRTRTYAVIALCISGLSVVATVIFRLF